MRNILLSALCITLFLGSFAQTKSFPYVQKWAMVDSLFNQASLPKDALLVVKEIQQQALKEKKQDVLIKALLAQITIEASFDEKTETYTIEQLEKQQRNYTGVALNIYKSILANAYQEYFNDNSYDIKDHEFKKNAKIEDWTTEQFYQRIIRLYQESLANPEQLNATKVESFGAIVSKGTNQIERKGLFDLLLYRAIYFANSKNNNDIPVDKQFQIPASVYTSSVASFIKTSFKPKDSTDGNFLTLYWIQKGLIFFQQKNETDRLVALRLELLNKYKEEADEKDFEQVLKSWLEEYKNNEAVQQIKLYAAKHYYEKGGAANIKTSLQYAQAVIAQSKIKERRELAKLIEDEIKFQTHRTTVESINIPYKPFRYLIAYKNISSVYVRIIKLNYKQVESLTDQINETDKVFSEVVTLPIARAYQQQIPSTEDYLEHSVEAKIDGLSPGMYALLTSDKQVFSPGQKGLSLCLFQVSDLGALLSGNDFFTVSRYTGKPVPKASVQYRTVLRDFITGKISYAISKPQFTNNNGHLVLDSAATKGNNSYSFIVKTNTDSSINNFGWIQPYSIQSEAAPETQIVLITDRGIYRPGQTLYFKGIAYQQRRGSNLMQLKKGLTDVIEIRDGNSSVVGRVTLTTNEFGSFHGKFDLPSQLMNGSIYFQDSLNLVSSYSVLVEEYKRPKFIVSYTPSKELKKLNDSIQAQFQALAYSGEPITNAKVSYSISTGGTWQAYPRQLRVRIPGINKSSPLITGETKTNETGSFTIPFKAIALNEEDSKSFSIKTMVTDATGETIEYNQTVYLQRYPLKLVDLFEDSYTKETIQKLVVSTTNYSNQEVSTPITVKIEKLSELNNPLRQRKWNTPDQFIYDEKTYHSFFPFDEYSNESDFKNRKTVNAQIVSGISSDKSAFKWDNYKWDEGSYKVSVIGSTPGSTDSLIRYFRINGDEKKWDDLEFSIDEKQVSGKAPQFQINSNIDTLNLIGFISSDRKNSRMIILNDVFKKSEPLVIEDSTQDYELSFATYRYNQFISRNEYFTAKKEDENLDFTIDGLRDKSIPGSSETVSIQFKGKDAERKSIELVASMYDQSLDAFNPNRIPSIDRYWAVNTHRRFQGVYNDQITASILNNNYPVDTINWSFDNIAETGVDGADYSYELVSTSKFISSKIDSDPAPSVRSNYEKGNTFGFFSEADKISYNLRGKVAGVDITANEKPKASAENPAPIRRNFSESAFFYPELRTDDSGRIKFTFTYPDALTKWRLQLFAHSLQGKSGYKEASTITQKDLMVQTSPPRFLREGDRMDYSTKIVNMTDKELTGQVQLQLFDPATNVPVDGWFRNFFPNQYFTVPANGSVPASFTIEVPYQYNKPVEARIIARVGTISDGESYTLPVLTNQVLITESLPIKMMGDGFKPFRFNSLLKSGGNEQILHQGITVEFTAQPLWYAVQALPALLENAQDCADQSLNKWFANELAASIIKTHPGMAKALEKWSKSKDPNFDAVLNKNPELKQAILRETPWVLEADNEATQLKNLALLLDMNKLSQQRINSIRLLKDLQNENGSFPWFKGGPDNSWMTNKVLTGIGRMKQLGLIDIDEEPIDEITDNALEYMDKYWNARRAEELKLKIAVPNASDAKIDYAFMRSYFSVNQKDTALANTLKWILKSIATGWNNQSIYNKARIALAAHRLGDKALAAAALKSIDQFALTDPELGMYWKENSARLYRSYGGVETQSAAIEAYATIQPDAAKITALQQWLLLQKQTRDWGTGSSTAEACYALLYNKANLASENRKIKITMGSTSFESNENSAPGGYFKEVIPAKNVKPSLGAIQVSVSGSQSNSPSWGAVYWQYFTDAANVKDIAAGMSLKKQVYKVSKTAKGESLELVTENNALKVGDRIRVKLMINSTRSFDYVQLKDTRSASMEPPLKDALSGYKWNKGLSYYQSFKDTRVEFYFDNLPKGSFTVEYDVFITHTGTFNNGITEIQCLYAPEFKAYSGVGRFQVEGN
ncbi:MAG: hypothetical protein K2P88_08975 [Chitinophagaceae bacterium]|nr:hypothetical protein [Chitinophagaceae bacterium]